MKIRSDASIFLDFFYQDGNIPDGYSADFAIVQKDSVIKSGSLDICDEGDCFSLRITSDTIQEVGIGEYMLLVSVKNEDTGYKDYIYEDNLKIV